VTTFKPGDRIRNVGDDGDLTRIPIGHEAIVRKVTDAVDGAITTIVFADKSGSLRYRKASAYELVAKQSAPFDATKLRKGDKVLVAATVGAGGANFAGHVPICREDTLGYLNPSQIIGYAPGYVPAPIEEPLKVGDKVTADVWPAGPLCIEKIDKEAGQALLCLWRDPLHEFFAVCPLSELKRVPI
jgi:hypothetical protein